MSIVLAEGYECDFGLIFELMNEAADSKEIRMLGLILLNKKEPSFLEYFSLVFALIF